jgi:hypothetical protein
VGEALGIGNDDNFDMIWNKLNEMNEMNETKSKQTDGVEINDNLTNWLNQITTQLECQNTDTNAHLYEIFEYQRIILAK